MATASDESRASPATLKDDPGATLLGEMDPVMTAVNAVGTVATVQLATNEGVFAPATPLDAVTRPTVPARPTDQRNGADQ